mmetsp:Transcript_26221/g.38852  ORF Transcript_26221/g.38852 Transcript_26221/m.38852 type:complete len:902 (-) Transcript_26221:36-2741(-)
MSSTGTIQDETAAFIKSLGLSGNGKVDPLETKSTKPSKKVNETTKHKNNARKWGKEKKEKSSLNTSISEKTVSKSPAPKAPKEIKWVNVKMDPSKSCISLTGELKWYELVTAFDGVDVNDHRTNKQNLELITSTVESAFAAEVALFHKNKNAGQTSEDEKWINEVIRSGTLSDKVAALALRIQNSPPHTLDTLDTLVAMAAKKEQRTSQLALEALKDLLVHNLLPDRRLRPFLSRPLGHPDMTMETALIFWFEDQLIIRMERIVAALEAGLKSSVDFFKGKCMEMTFEWIVGKPEQEGRLLAALVNKLGDPSSKICTRCIDLLGKVVYRHPAMKGVMVREVRQLISRPNLPPRAVYSGVLFLSQLTLSRAESEVAGQLVECYVSLFEKAVTQEQLGSKLLSALLSGINRAFPFLVDRSGLSKHLDALFRIVHKSSFSTATQALTLISHLALSGDIGAEQGADKGSNDKQIVDKDLISRFYRSLYAKLLSDDILTRTHNTLFLNLLFRSMKRDPLEMRVMAYVKRVLLCASHSTAPVAAGLIFLVSEVCKARPTVRDQLLSRVETVDAPEDSEEMYWALGNFDASKRDPEHSCKAPASAWEMTLFRSHFHPSVQAFATSFLDPRSDHTISYSGDPTVDLSLTAFLNRFAYKNPKKSMVEQRRRRAQAAQEDPVNSSAFVHAQPSEIAPEKAFFYKFFGDRNRLRAEGKSRNRSKKRQSEDDDDDDDDNSDLGSDFGEEEIDKFADRLAEDLMEDHDDEDLSDMGDFVSDGEDDGDDFDGDEPSAVNEDDDSDDMMDPDADGSVGSADSDSDDDGGIQLQQWEDDENASGMESETSDIDFSEFVEKKTKKQSKSKKRSAKSASVFADAGDYEDEAEANVRDVMSSKSSEKNSKKSSKRRKKDH